MSLVSLYGGWKTSAKATITVVDNNGAAVNGATVSGHWESATSDTDSGITNASGMVTPSSDSLRRPPSGTTFIYRVDGVTKSGCIYDTAANVESSDLISVP